MTNSYKHIYHHVVRALLENLGYNFPLPWAYCFR